MACIYCMELPEEGKCVRDGCTKCCQCGREIELLSAYDKIATLKSWLTSIGLAVQGIHHPVPGDDSVVAMGLIELHLGHIAKMGNRLSTKNFQISGNEDGNVDVHISRITWPEEWPA